LTKTGQTMKLNSTILVMKNLSSTLIKTCLLRFKSKDHN